MLWRVIELRTKGLVALSGEAVDTCPPRLEFEANIDTLSAFSAAMGEIKAPRSNPWWGFWADQLNPNRCRPVADCIEQLQQIATTARELSSQLIADFGEDIISWGIQREGSTFAALSELANSYPNEASVSQLIALTTLECRDLANELIELCSARTSRLQLCNSMVLANRENATRDSLQVFDLLKGPLRSVPLQMTLSQVRSLRAQLGSLQFALQEAMNIAEQLEEQGLGPIRSFKEFKAAEQLFALLRHRIVHDGQIAPHLFLIAARTRFQQAQSRCQTLLRQREALDQAFDLSSLPQRTELQQLTRTFRKYSVSWWRWFTREYWTTKENLAQFARGELLRQPSDRWIDELEKLDRYLIEAAQFAEDAGYRQLFGAYFSGFETDWVEIKTKLAWSVTAQQQGLDHVRANQLLSRRQLGSPRAQSVTDARTGLQAEFGNMDVLALLAIEPHLDDAPLADVLTRAIDVAKHMDDMEALLRSQFINEQATLAEIKDQCAVLIDLEDCSKQLNDRTRWQKLGEWSNGSETNADLLARCCSWITEFVDVGLPNHAKATVLNCPSSERCGELADKLTLLHEQLDKWNTTRDTLLQFGRMDSDWLPLFDSGQRLVGADAAERLQDAICDLPAWTAMCRLLAESDAKGLQGFTRAAFSGEVDNERLADTYRFTVFEAAAERGVWSSAPLKNFSRTTLENARRRFKELDVELLKVNCQAAAHQASLADPPLGNGQGKVADFTEMGLIRNEVAKQRNHCRIRKLFIRAGAAVQALKPCWMMSPLSVAQFLDPNSLQFDLVIMDEASQIKPEDAFGAILRAKQLVVVGDPKQLPPTSFFALGDGDEDADDNAGQLVDTESILEAASKTFQPKRLLRWHYRSQHESLIRFSNSRFYDNELIVFPSATRSGGNLGLRHHFIPNAVFSGGCNAIEAEAVAKAIVDHAKKYPHESLGVGTFNRKQSELTQELLDRLCKTDIEAQNAVEQLNDRPDKLFIKNLENLQGDERDVIFISYTYGPDSVNGPVMNRFGPITQQLGWRRLNVLVTRAKRRVEVFASLSPSDITNADQRSGGVKAYKDYLEYCQTGRLVDEGRATGRPPDSEFEEAVAAVVRRTGFDVMPQVGVAGYFIDIGVLRPGTTDEFILGIECDGAAYHSSRSARDRDRLREEVIRSRGWKLHRIWSTDWYLNQRHEEERLSTAIRDLLPNLV